MKKKLFVSLFSGAGGLDLGFMDAGWEPALMVDNWKPAEKTLLRNHSRFAGRIHGWDMAALTYGSFDAALRKAGAQHRDILCVAGGPPCQPFSRLNQNELFGKGQKPAKKNLNDPRRSLFMDFLRLVAHVRPPFVVMENVFDLKTRKLGGTGPDKNRLIVDIIQQEFDKADYDVARGVLDARNYDVPQMRRRMIFIGVRKDLGIVPVLPAPMVLATSVRAEFAKIRLDHPNQVRKKPSEGWLKRVRHIPPGGYYNDLPLEHKVLKPVDIAYVSEYDGQVRHYCVKRTDGSWDEFRTSKDADKVARFVGRHEGWELSMSQLESDTEGCQIFRVMPRMGTYLRRIRWDVSHTVTRNPLIHPAENRELTVREKASIQTFPPDYEFCGSAQDQHVLVGNAVPCNLGRAIAKHLERMG